jgi:hypothetical protein
MRYEKPQLYPLVGTVSLLGNCGNGSGANPVAYGCTDGLGDDGGGICSFGTGAGYYCFNGTGAFDSGDFCSLGTSPNTACVTGTGPAL